MDLIQWGIVAHKDKQRHVLFHVQISASHFHTCVFVWEWVRAEIRKLERGPWEEVNEVLEIKV